jgi:hypothetical protein
MQFRLLGPLEAVERDRARALGGAGSASPHNRSNSARSSSPRAAQKLRKALALWRGPPLADPGS